MHPSPAIDTTLLPVERTLFCSDQIVIGRFDMPLGSPWMGWSGPVRNDVIAFPRTIIALRQEGRREFTATPSVVTLHNRGETFQRKPLQDRGDVSDWIAVSPAALASISPDVASRIERGLPPFPEGCATLSADEFLHERVLVAAVERGEAEAAFVVETAMHLIAAVVSRAERSHDVVRRDAAAAIAEEVKLRLAQDLDRPLPLDTIAADVGLSVFHLCRLFRAQTGTTMHRYRMVLRLRMAFERILEDPDLLSAALSFGFNGHSHFTALFRRHFGITPSTARRLVRKGFALDNGVANALLRRDSDASFISPAEAGRRS